MMTVNADDNFMQLPVLEQLKFIHEQLPRFITQNFLEEVTDSKHYRLFEIANPEWSIEEKWANVTLNAKQLIAHKLV